MTKGLQKLLMVFTIQVCCQDRKDACEYEEKDERVQDRQDGGCEGGQEMVERMVPLDQLDDTENTYKPDQIQSWPFWLSNPYPADYHDQDVEPVPS